MPAARAHNHTLVDEHVAGFDGSVQQATHVATQIQNQRLDRMILELQYFAQLARRIFAECRDANVADAGLALQEVVPPPVFQHGVSQHRFRPNQLALNLQPDRLRVLDPHVESAA